MINALTVDVEDYFQVTAFERYIRNEDWDNYPLRVVDNTFKILDMLDEFSVKSTFFVLGWVAERCPTLIKEIQNRGHEIACHGYIHKPVYNVDPENFRRDIRRAKKVTEDICGKKIIGFRAPSFSIIKESIWAFDILIEEGFLYDSSIFPIVHDIYGIPDAHRFPHEISRTSGLIKEFPISTFQIKIANFDYRIPIAGGGYIRLFPLWLIKKAIFHINIKEKQPVVLYFHSWEIDPEQPRIKSSMKSRFRHYTNLDKTMKKLNNLLSSFKFAPMGEVLGINREFEGCFKQ